MDQEERRKKHRIGQRKEEALPNMTNYRLACEDIKVSCRLCNDAALLSTSSGIGPNAIRIEMMLLHIGPRC